MGASTWDDVPAPAGDSWQADGGKSAGGWEPDASAAQDSAFEVSPANTSQHAEGGFDDAPADGGCRNCHADGHFARDCPEEPRQQNSGECYNCGQMGHSKADCTNERVEREFTGECHTCGQAGHRSADCPDAAPKICKLCKGEGHIATDCEVNRMHSHIAGLGVQQLAGDVAWDALVAADKTKDVEDIKAAVWTYAAAYPELTFEDLEKAFREGGMNTYLIAKQQELVGVWTSVNLQGKTGMTYVVSFQFSEKPRRAKFAEGWPSSPEENYTRLAEAGIPLDSLLMKCTNCNEIGHPAKECPEDKNEGARVAISCYNCNEEGHRARDCTQERKTNKKGCRNCGDEGHISKECPEPPNLDNVECKNCNQMGHFSRECPDRAPEVCHNCWEEGHRSKECPNEKKLKCRNCDEFGHQSRECKKPTDWSRVKCTNCEEFGHSYKRCPKPIVPAEDADEEGGASFGGGGGDGGWGAGDSAGGSGGFGGGFDAPAESAGGGW